MISWTLIPFDGLPCYLDYCSNLEEELSACKYTVLILSNSWNEIFAMPSDVDV